MQSVTSNCSSYGSVSVTAAHSIDAVPTPHRATGPGHDSCHSYLALFPSSLLVEL